MRPPQALDAARSGIAVGTRIAGGFDQLVDDVRRRRHVGIAHAEIDDVFAARARSRLKAVDLFEDVRRQTPYTVEFALHGLRTDIRRLRSHGRATSRQNAQCVDCNHTPFSLE